MQSPIQPAQLDPAAPARPHATRVWLVAFAAALLLFTLTLAPDVLMMDSGEYQLAVFRFPQLDLGDRPADLVRVHPIYLAVAKIVSLAPVSNFAARVNFVSALFGAIAVANVAWLAYRLTGCRVVATFSALVLAFGHTLWAFAVIAEIMTMLAAMLTTELLLWYAWSISFRKRWLILLAVVNGLGVAAHLQLGLTTFAYVAGLLWLWRTRRLSFSFLLLWAAVWLAATLPYSALVAWYGVKTGDWRFILQSATSGRFGATPRQLRPRTIIRGLAALLLNYPTLLIVLAVPGALRLRRLADPVFVAVFLAAASIQFLFPLTYAVPDQYSFFVPFYAVAAVLIGVGAYNLLRRRTWQLILFALAVLPAAVYAAAPAAARRANLKLFNRSLPYRDPYVFFLKPWKNGDRGQRRYVTEVFDQLPPNAVLFTSFTTRFMLEFVQEAEHRRPDVLITDSLADLNSLWHRPIYANDAEANDFPAALRDRCAPMPDGLLWKLTPPPEPLRP